MAKTWSHPKLGRFEYEGMGWSRIVDLPVFKAFSYDTGYSNAPRSTGKHSLVFGASSESEVPPPDEIELAEAILSNQKDLVGVVTSALWEDFNGRRPDSGMWWHGDFETVARSFKELRLSPPSKADDLLPTLQLNKILIPRRFPDYEKLLAELNFHAAFEEEHGVSVLTDGQSVLGAGYNLDVLPFDYKPRPRRSPFG
ncbi:MAG: hypothetical protein H0T11_09760 [Chthoniobacterales bacterium]|nr:hypothetical protein [Chthoniobacterales bacterium]